MNSRELMSQMKESVAQTYAENTNVPIEKAREWVETFFNKRWEKRKRTYEFLKTCRPGVSQIDDRQWKSIQRMAEDVQISEEIAEAATIVGEIEQANFRKIRKLKNPTPEQEIQTLLGVNVPIPKEIIDLYLAESNSK